MRSRAPSSPDLSPAHLFLSPKLEVRFESTDEIKQQKLQKLTNIPRSPTWNTEENGNVAGIIVLVQEKTISKETTFNKIEYVRSFNQCENFLNRPRALNGAGLYGVRFISGRRVTAELQSRRPRQAAGNHRKLLPVS